MDDSLSVKSGLRASKIYKLKIKCRQISSLIAKFQIELPLKMAFLAAQAWRNFDLLNFRKAFDLKIWQGDYFKSITMLNNPPQTLNLQHKFLYESLPTLEFLSSKTTVNQSLPRKMLKGQLILKFLLPMNFGAPLLDQQFSCRELAT